MSRQEHRFGERVIFACREEQMTKSAVSRRLSGKGSTHDTGMPLEEVCAAAQHGEKWQGIMPCLRMARKALGLNRGRLELLEKLMACVPGDRLTMGPDGRLIVFASNARLAEMTNRDCDKTITRLITELAGRGLLERHASPNGKRFARRGPGGDVVAYGLDLGPLLRALPRITRLATSEAAEQEACARLREECSLLLATMADADPVHAAEMRRKLRRKLDKRDLEALAVSMRRREGQGSDTTSQETEVVQTTKMRCSAPQNERHKESSHEKERKKITLTPDMVEQAMPRVANLGRQINTSLRGLVDHLRRAMCINDRSWNFSLEKLGFEESALLTMVLYERQTKYRNPPAYFVSVVRNAGPSSLPGHEMLNTLVRTSGERRAYL